MADGQRIYPVNRFVLHHSTGPDFTNADHDSIAKWFSDIGKNRGYAGLAHSYHYYTPKNGKRYETFAQAHLAGHWHNNKYCIFPVMDDIWNNVAWGAGNWKINQQAINLENCGNYLNKTFNDIQRRAVADWWRPHDQKLNGKTYINGHKDFSATACPGKIYEAIPTIVQYINTPPLPPADPLKKCKDEKKQLAQTLAGVSLELEQCKTQLQDEKARTSKLEADNKELSDKNTALERHNAELSGDLVKCKKLSASLVKEINRLRKELEKCNDCGTFLEWLQCKLDNLRSKK